MNQVKKKNRVYIAENLADSDDGCDYIAAKTLKEAKKIALSSRIGQLTDNYLDLSVSWQKGVTTNYEGELDIYEINELGLSWWDCPKCNKEEFEIIDKWNCKCKNCSNEFEIPYLS